MIRPVDYPTLGYVSNSLGVVSADEEIIAAESGVIDDMTLQMLSAAGATDNDIDMLIAGTTTVQALEIEYGVNSPSAPLPASTVATPTPLAPATPAATAAANPAPATSAPAPQVPSGSSLLYTASWSAGVGNLTVTPNNVIAALTSGLQAHGMSVTGSAVTGSGPISYGIQVNVLDSVGNNLLTDAKSVLDSLVQSAIGGSMSGSNISLTSTPSQAGNPVAASPSSLSTWFQNNGVLVIGILAAAVVLPSMFGGKRR